MSQKVLGPAVYPIEINDEVEIAAQINLSDNTTPATATVTALYTVDSVMIGDFVDVAVICPDTVPATEWVEPDAAIFVTARVAVSDDPLSSPPVPGKVRVTFTNTAAVAKTILAGSRIFIKVRKRDGVSLPTLP